MGLGLEFPMMEHPSMSMTYRVCLLIQQAKSFPQWRDDNRLVCRFRRFNGNFVSVCQSG